MSINPNPDRLDDLRAEYAQTGMVTSDGAVWLFSQVVVLREQVQRLKAEAAVSVVPPATNQTALRERIAEALVSWTYRGKEPDPETGMLETVRANAYSRADAVLAVLPAPVDQAAVLTEAATRYEEILANADTGQDPRYWTAVRDITLGLRAMADEERDEQQAQASFDQLADDLAAAIASCPGYEMSPSPCRCPCEGCKHHCGAHDPQPAVASRVAAEAPHTETPDALPFTHVDDDGDRLEVGAVMASTYDGEAPVVYVAAEQHQGDQVATVYVRPERVERVIAAMRSARRATEQLPAVVAQPGKETDRG